MAKKLFPSDEQERFMVRFPDGMRSHIAELAERNHRSMNSEILARLERTFRWDQVEHPHPGELSAEIQQAAARLQELIREFQLLQVDRSS